jgi:predicted acetyltransferase
MDIVLTPMSADRGAEFDAMLAEFRAAGEMHVYQGDFAVAWQGYAAFYDLLSRMKAGGYPTPDIVPMDSYFIERGGYVLGDLYIRPRLSPRLEKLGGHIGYRVRPSERNHGAATTALRLALQKLAAISVERALLTCRETNAASARVIEKCGAVRVEDSESEYGRNRRYWVPTGSAKPEKQIPRSARDDTL